LFIATRLSKSGIVNMFLKLLMTAILIAAIYWSRLIRVIEVIEALLRRRMN